MVTSSVPHPTVVGHGPYSFWCDTLEERDELWKMLRHKLLGRSGTIEFWNDLDRLNTWHLWASGLHELDRDVWVHAKELDFNHIEVVFDDRAIAVTHLAGENPTELAVEQYGDLRRSYGDNAMMATFDWSGGCVAFLTTGLSDSRYRVCEL